MSSSGFFGGGANGRRPWYRFSAVKGVKED
jgi:hypothetical protein